jgi:serine/threonine protein kinase
MTPTDTPRLGPYRLDRVLGKGSSATVHLAQDERDARWVAIKVLTPGWEPAEVDREEVHQRFAQEAAIVQRVQHPDIVAVLETGESAGRLWLAMELAAGCGLDRYAQPRLLLPARVVLETCARVAGTLAHAHAQGVIHRDIKPANVLVDLATQSVKVTDFGTARLLDGRRTRTGLMLGTPAYMAPELLAGAPADARSDLYSLGVMLFELLAGQRPHDATSMGELLRRIANQAPPDLQTLRPTLPRGLIELVDSLLAKQPSRRPPSGQVVAAGLLTWIEPLIQAEEAANSGKLSR